MSSYEKLTARNTRPKSLGSADVALAEFVWAAALHLHSSLVKDAKWTPMIDAVPSAANVEYSVQDLANRTA